MLGRHHGNAPEDVERWLLNYSPIGEIILAGARGTSLTPEDLAQLKYRRDELTLQPPEGQLEKNELVYIESILTRAGIPLGVPDAE